MRGLSGSDFLLVGGGILFVLWSLGDIKDQQKETIAELQRIRAHLECAVGTPPSSNPCGRKVP